MALSHGIDVHDASKYVVNIDPEETGKTYYENAAIKASAFKKKLPSHVWVMGEDSGIERDHDNWPGVYTARIRKKTSVGHIMNDLHDHPISYHCSIVIHSPEGKIKHFSSSLKGVGRRTPSGSGGFDFDPYFVLKDGRTVAELPSREKDRVSHRGAAVRAAFSYIKATHR